MADTLVTPYKTYRAKSYPAIDPTQPPLSTQSKSAVVTGAGTGIGAEIALSLAKSSISYLALIGRREDALQKTKSAIKAFSGSTKIFIYAADIANLTGIQSALSSFAQESPSGKINILVANAGTLGPLASISDAGPDAWWSGFEINVRGNFNLIRAFLPHVNSAASVVYISSAVVHGPYVPSEFSYAASKIGATKLFDHLHYERPDLFVLFVQPGLIPDTNMLEGFNHIAKGLKMDYADLPWDDAALPADFVVWAVSPEARFLNGRFVWANWDVDELKADKEAILADPRKFNLNLQK